jgi:hypothetical protein
MDTCNEGLREFSNQTFGLDQSDFELPLMVDFLVDNRKTVSANPLQAQTLVSIHIYSRYRTSTLPMFAYITCKNVDSYRQFRCQIPHEADKVVSQYTH